MLKLSEIKKELHAKCVDIAQQKVADLKTIIQEAQNAANNETKSSAGDKHETGRAMAQLETEKLSKQLSEALKLAQIITQINPKEAHQKIGLGSIVLTNNGIFYIAVSLGKIMLENQTYFVISAASPIGKQLIGLTEDTIFTFNEKSYKIKQVS